MCVIICGQRCKHVFLWLVEQEKDPAFWKEWAQRTLKNALTLQDLNKNVAKNIILFLGDGKSCNWWIFILRSLLLSFSNQVLKTVCAVPGLTERVKYFFKALLQCMNLLQI